MIKKSGDLFTSTAPALAHGVNCLGQMGAGIAKLFKEKFPKNYTAYRNACDTKLLQTGEAFIFHGEAKVIVNLASQYLPGPNATYTAVFSSALDAAQQLVAHDIDTLAIPLVGCGIGGLEWPVVEQLLRAVEMIAPNFEFEVWKL